MLDSTKIQDALRELNEEMDAIQASAHKLETLSDSLNAATEDTLTVVTEDLPSHQEFREWREALDVLFVRDPANRRGLEGLDDFLKKFQEAT